jgi:hypothetical protein
MEFPLVLARGVFNDGEDDIGHPVDVPCEFVCRFTIDLRCMLRNNNAVVTLSVADDGSSMGALSGDGEADWEGQCHSQREL